MVLQKGWKVPDDKKEGHVNCSLTPKPDIFIEPIPKDKIDILMEEYSHQEWLGYLVGRIAETGNFFVEDIVIPPHAEASGASAEAEPFNIPENCIGIIHSHHGMGAFHSGTDRSYVDKNFPTSITVALKSGDLEFDAVSYQVTPCDRRTTNDCDVRFVSPPPLFDEEKWLGEAKDNIKKGENNRVYFYPSRPITKSVTQEEINADEEEIMGFLDKEGNIITRKEYNEHMRGIYPDSGLWD